MQCAQTRGHLSLAQLLLPLPASFDRYQHHHRHEQERSGSPVDTGSSSDARHHLRMTVVLLAASPACSSADCPVQISSSGARGFKTLRFTWSGGVSQETLNESLKETLTLGGQQAASSLPSTNASYTQPPIAVHLSSSCFTAASSPPFFPVPDALPLSRFPFHRHAVILPPCAAAQVRLCFCFCLCLPSLSLSPSPSSAPFASPFLVVQVSVPLAEIANTFLVMLSCIITLRNAPQQPSDASWSMSTSSLLQVSNPLPPHTPPSRSHAVCLLRRAPCRPLSEASSWQTLPYLRLKQHRCHLCAVMPFSRAIFCRPFFR